MVVSLFGKIGILYDDEILQVLVREMRFVDIQNGLLKQGFIPPPSFVWVWSEVLQEKCKKKSHAPRTNQVFIVIFI